MQENIMAMQNKVGATNPDLYLSDYINRTMKELEQDKRINPPVDNPNDYEVYPEITDESDLPRNPYSRV